MSQRLLYAGYQIPRANHKRHDKEAVDICSGEGSISGAEGNLALERLEAWVYPMSGGISQCKVRTSIFYSLSYILCFMGNPTVLNSLSTNKVCMGFLNRVYRRQKVCPCIFSLSGDRVRKQF